MEIKFTIEPDVDEDNYRELYTADILWEDGTSFTFRMNEDEISYDEFRADIFEDLFRALAESEGISVTIEEEDYANLSLEDIDLLDDLLEDYLDEDGRCGC